MHFSWIKKDLVGNGKKFRSGEIYYTQSRNVKSTLENLKLRGVAKAIEIVPINKLLKAYSFGDKGTMLIVRFGGIGDLLALSSTRNIVSNNIEFITKGVYDPVFEWWQDPPQKIIDVAKPLYHNIGFLEWIKMQRETKILSIEGTVENGGEKNWYEIFFNAMNAGYKGSFCRPLLKKHRIHPEKSNIDLSIPSIVVCPRSTSNMRSMSFEAIYRALFEVIGFTKANIYVHEVNASEGDRAFIVGLNDKRVKIIKAGSIKEFLLDLYDCNLTISVDTSAVHFREGIEKPGIGIYSSFTTGSRTKYYKFAHSFDIKSPCNIQPCFQHQYILNQVCGLADHGSDCAPCLTESFNPDLKSQLVVSMRDYINSVL